MCEMFRAIFKDLESNFKIWENFRKSPKRCELNQSPKPEAWLKLDCVLKPSVPCSMAVCSQYRVLPEGIELSHTSTLAPPLFLLVVKLGSFQYISHNLPNLSGTSNTSFTQKYCRGFPITPLYLLGLSGLWLKPTASHCLMWCLKDSPHALVFTSVLNVLVNMVVLCLLWF